MLFKRARSLGTNSKSLQISWDDSSPGLALLMRRAQQEGLLERLGFYWTSNIRALIILILFFSFIYFPTIFLDDSFASS
jgi:hypothetical protein